MPHGKCSVSIFFFLPQLETGLCRQRPGFLRFTFPEELWAADVKNTQKPLRFLFLQLYQNFTATMIV